MNKKKTDKEPDMTDITDIAHILDEVVSQEETVPIDTIKEIGYLDPAWSDYVISRLDESELKDGYPTVGGLRRIIEVLLGPVVESKSSRLYIGEEIICEYEITVKWHLDNDGFNRDLVETQFRKFGGVASSGPQNNNDATFSKYHAAVAETRAEGRALRKALRLNTIFAEEVSGQIDATNNDGAITSIQKNFIANKCNLLGLNVEDFLRKHNFDSFDKVPRSDAAQLIRVLNLIQTERDTNEG